MIDDSRLKGEESIEPQIGQILEGRFHPDVFLKSA
jgi:hypothetical protein